MREPFISMRDYLRPPEAPREFTDEPLEEERCEPEREPFHDIEVAAALRDARHFRAVLADLVELRSREAWKDIAAEVVGRELMLAPADLHAIVQRAIDRGNDVLRVRVHPLDADRLDVAWPIVPDESLRTGDAVIETREGTIDARLGVRLAMLLDTGRR